MKKAVTIATLAVSCLFGASTQEVKNFVTKTINPSVKITAFKLTETRKVKDLPGWEKVTFLAKAGVLDKNGKMGVQSESSGVIFTNGRFVTYDFYDTKEGATLSEILAKGPDASFYTKETLVAGNMNAENKVVIFSDPKCPFCKEFVPDAIKAANDKPEKMAIFLYHMPLVSIHPESKFIIKAMIAAQLKGKKVVQSVYTSEFNGKTEALVLKDFEKHTGIKLTSAEINSKAVLAHYNDGVNKSVALSVSGTPAVYVNGKPDPQRKVFSSISGI